MRRLADVFATANVSEAYCGITAGRPEYFDHTGATPSAKQEDFR
jgi:hypothetical protein